MSEGLCVGVDAGGTSTVAAASRGGGLLGSERGGPANARTVGSAVAAHVIAETVLRASGGAQPDSIYAAVAGAGEPDVAQQLSVALRTTFPDAKILVADDTAAALRAAIGEGPGIVLIAGTGSVGYAENGEKRVRVGGYGYLAGDEGSAFAIGFSEIGRAHV